MKIRSRSESHIVELDDGSRWQIFPGDLGLTPNWKPETDLAVVRIDDEVSSHALVGEGCKGARDTRRRKLAGIGGEVRAQGRLMPPVSSLSELSGRRFPSAARIDIGHCARDPAALSGELAPPAATCRKSGSRESLNGRSSTKRRLRISRAWSSKWAF